VGRPGGDDAVEALLAARGRALVGYAYLLCGAARG
jgi:hypothetical protein